MVERIQRLSAELKLQALRQRECPEQTQVDVEEPRSVEVVPPSVPKALGLARRSTYRRVGCGIEIPIAQTDAAENLHLRLDLVRILTATWRVKIPGNTLNNVDWSAASNRYDAVQLKASEQPGCDATASP